MPTNCFDSDLPGVPFCGAPGFSVTRTKDLAMRFIPATIVITAALAVTPALLPSAKAADEAAGPIRALYLTGGCCHDYDTQKQLLTDGLGARANIAWTIDHEGGSSSDHKLSRHQQPDWAEPFDVVVYNMCFAAVRDDDFIENITRAHHDSDTGAVLLHCAMHSYRDAATDAWDRLIGLDTYHHEAQSSFLVEAVDGGHPIMAGFPEGGWQTPRDELYIVRESFDTLIPLASAYGEQTEQEHVVIWANEYGESRVFGTTVGHNTPTIADPVFLDTVARGLLWTVGKLDDAGDPMPGYEGTGEGLTTDEPFDHANATRLSGESIGTEGSWDDSGNTRDKALDGDTDTFFDAPHGEGAWVGLDLGEPTVIVGVRYAPREGYEERMNGGRFQGANKADFRDAVDLHTVLFIGDDGIISRRVNQDQAFRYVRYLSPDGGFGNVSVIEFYGE